MRKVTILFHQDTKEFEADFSSAEGLTESEICDGLLSAYVNTAKRIIENHSCDNPNCCLVTYNKEIIDAIEEIIKIHELKHKHG